MIKLEDLSLLIILRMIQPNGVQPFDGVVEGERLHYE